MDEPSYETLDRNSLTIVEQRVMAGAIDASELEGVWATFLPDEHIANFERAYLYVPVLAVAAPHLGRGSCRD